MYERGYAQQKMMLMNSYKVLLGTALTCPSSWILGLENMGGYYMANSPFRGVVSTVFRERSVWGYDTFL